MRTFSPLRYAAALALTTALGCSSSGQQPDSAPDGGPSIENELDSDGSDEREPDESVNPNTPNEPTDKSEPPNPEDRPLPTDPTLDSDGDGLTDIDEITKHGTSTVAKDTDGDGFSDFEEVINKAFDGTANATQFNPLVADVPELRVEVVSAPAIAIVYTENNQSGQTLGTERTNATTSAVTKSWGGSQSHSVEMTHSAGVEIGVEHEFGPTGGTSVSATLSYEFSHSTTNESTVSWSNEQMQENSNALAQIESKESSQGVNVDGGYLQLSVVLHNDGDIAFALKDLTLSAYTRNTGDAFAFSPIGTLSYLGPNNATVFPETVLKPGRASVPLTFTLDLDLGTTKDLLADSSNLVIAQATGTLKGDEDLNFELAATNIGARTAQIIIDYGLDEPQETYRVAATVDPENPGVGAARALRDTLRIPVKTGNAPWVFGKETNPRDSFQGVTRVRGKKMSDTQSSYWIVSHTRAEENGAKRVTDHHNPTLADFDLEQVTLQKGDVLHLVYVADPDRDGLGSRAEFLYGTDPNKADTDDDQLSDSVEISGWEINHEDNPLRVFSNPLVIDTDADGDDDFVEYNQGTHPALATENVLPSIEFSATVKGFTVVLEVTANDADGQVKSYDVDWGDGQSETIALSAAGALQPSHQYTQAGDYTVRLVATDDAGEQSAAQSRTLTTTLPSEGLLLHMQFDSDLTARVGSALSDAGRFSVYANGRNTQNGAYDLRGGNNSEEYSMLYGSHLGFSQSFTLAIWLYQTESLGGNRRRVVGQGNWFNLYASSSEQMTWGLMDESTTDLSSLAHVQDETPMTQKQWTFYVGVVEQTGATSSLRLYRDGELAKSRDVENTVFVNPGSCSFYVGPLPANNFCKGTEVPQEEKLPGLVDDLRVFNRALSPEEIRALYNE